MTSLPPRLLIASLSLAMLQFATERGTADVLLSEDFTGGDGGFTQTTSGAPANPWTFNAAGANWFTDGEANESASVNHYLDSPAINIPTPLDSPPVLRISFDHRYSIETGDWDAGALQYNVNGGAFITVPNEDFLQNGYNNAIPLQGGHDLVGGNGFVANSLDFVGGTLITSIADVGGLAAGDVVIVRFIAAFDSFAKGEFLPNWEINGVTVETLDDNDSDGLPNDFEEQFAFLNPNDPADAALDEDTDGLTNLEEFEAGTILDNPDSDGDDLEDGAETNTGTWVSPSDSGTDPLNPDSDGDGLNDGVENHDLPFDSQNPTTQPGSDPNIANTDGDAAPDGLEVANGTDPTDPDRFPAFIEFLEFRYEFDTNTGPLPDSSGNNLPDMIVTTNGPVHRFGEPSLVGGNGFSIGLDAPGNAHTTGSYLRVLDPPDPDSFSFSLWIKPNYPGQQNPLFSRENVWSPSPGVFYSLFVDNTGGLVWITGQTQSIATDPGIITDGEIHHIVVTHSDIDGKGTFQTERGRLYVDGVMIAEVGNPTEVPPVASNMDGNQIYRTIWLGTKSAGPGYKGEMDDFQMYNIELSEEQVEGMYLNPGTIASFSPPPPFEIKSIAAVDNGGSVEITLIWNSKSSQSYAVDSFDPVIGQWTELVDGVQGADGPTTETNFTDMGSVSPTLYRVRLE